MDKRNDSIDSYDNFELNQDALKGINNQHFSRRSSEINILNEEKKIELINREKPKNNFFKKVFCKKCYSIPSIKFLNNNLLQSSCKCRKLINICGGKFYEEYLVKLRKGDLQNLDLDYNLICKIHNKQFKFYCIDCKLNLCEICAKLKVHENHINTFENLIIDEESIREINNLIKNIKISLNSKDIEKRELLNIIKRNINGINTYPCHNNYKNLKRFRAFLEALSTDIPKIIEMKKINQLSDFTNIIDPLFLSSIKIRGDKTYTDLSILKDFDLKNLESLKWKHSIIDNIDGILNKNFENLKVLDLEYNNLDENCMKFKQKYFPKLEFLNLYHNNIKSIQIFKIVQNFKKLIKFHVGDNNFNEEEINTLKEKINLKQIKELGVTGCFSDSKVKFMKNLIFKDLKTLYISRNHLSTLSFMDFENLKNLKKITKFWAIENNLKDINELQYLANLKTLEIINLKNNKIGSLKGLLDIVKNFPNLKKLTLEGNPIDIEKDKEIIEKLRKKIKLII